jgi:antitoxin CptB
MTQGAVELARLRWRCRRGLLELDIVLGQFIEQGYASLNEAQKIKFDALLDLSDNALWDRITEKEPAKDQEEIILLNSINKL